MEEHEIAQIREVHVICSKLLAAHEKTASAPGPLNHWNVLDSIRQEIQAEHTLASHRLTLFVTSQAFLVTGLATSFNLNNGSICFFSHAIPWLGVLLSIFTWIGVWSALSVQWDLIYLQLKVLNGLKEKSNQRTDTFGTDALSDYIKLTCFGRRSRHHSHWIAMTPPFVVPLVFTILWLAAYYWISSLPKCGASCGTSPALAVMFVIVVVFLLVAAICASELRTQIREATRETASNQ